MRLAGPSAPMTIRASMDSPFASIRQPPSCREIPVTRGDLPVGHASGGACTDDDRVEHVAQGVRGGYIGLTPWPRQGIAPRGLLRGRSSDTRTAGPRGEEPVPAVS